MKRGIIRAVAATRDAMLCVAAAAGLIGVPVAAQAQTATLYGSISNFDVVNNTGYHAHGYELELEGIQQEHVYVTFGFQRYGTPTIVPYTSDVYPYPTGVRVRWTSPYDPDTQQFLQTTIAHAEGAPFAGTCYQWYPATYDAAGCEHFGVALTINPAKVTSRWLLADPAAPGELVRASPIAVALPVYTVVPPAQAGNPPVLVAEVRAPQPAEALGLYGDAQWVKIFVTQLPREVNLDELVADNPLVPQDAGQVEADWDLIQAEPGGRSPRGNKQNGGNIDPTTRAVVRRIELYKYTGAYSPVTHEALCADLACKVISPGELGDFISAQMTAANVQSDSVEVAVSGNGKVESADSRVRCPGDCVAPYNQGTVVTLTVRAGSDSVFGGWTGPCSGTAPSCSVMATGHVAVGATFVAVKTGGGGGGGSTTTTSGGGKGGGGKSK